MRISKPHLSLFFLFQGFFLSPEISQQLNYSFRARACDNLSDVCTHAIPSFLSPGKLTALMELNAEH